MLFPIVIHKDEDSGYGVTVPDLPGCFSAGDTFEEAIESAHEAVACHLEGLLLDDHPIPLKTPFEAHRLNKDYEGGTWALVTFDFTKLSSKARRVTITMPSGVLATVDQASARAGEKEDGGTGKSPLLALLRVSQKLPHRPGAGGCPEEKGKERRFPNRRTPV